MLEGEGRTWRPEDMLPPIVGAVGLVTIVLGTFLPWLRSGTHERNSYQAGGAVRRLVEPSATVDHLLALWPFISTTRVDATLSDRIRNSSTSSVTWASVKPESTTPRSRRERL